MKKRILILTLHEKLGPFSLLILVYDSSLLRDRIARCFFQIYSGYTHSLDFDQFTMILNYFFVNEEYCFFLLRKPE